LSLQVAGTRAYAGFDARTTGMHAVGKPMIRIKAAATNGR
jgi:hypothetical protein